MVGTASQWWAPLLLVSSTALTPALAQTAGDSPDDITVPHGPCTSATDTEPQVCKIRLPAVKRIQFDQPLLTGVQAPGEPDCRSFRPTAKDVQRFLQKTGTVAERDWQHTLDWTACSVSGTARLVDGRTATWQLYPTKRGRFQVNGGPVIFLYCTSCKARAFW